MVVHVANICGTIREHLSVTDAADRELQLNTDLDLLTALLGDMNN